METIHDRDLSRCNISYHFGDEEWVEFRSDSIFIQCIISYFLFKSMNTSDTYTVNYTYSIQIFFFEVHSRILHRFFSSCNGILCIQIHFAKFFTVNVISSIEILHFACKMSLEFRRIEMSNRSCSTNPIHKIFPEFGNTVANGSNGAETCYYNSF